MIEINRQVLMDLFSYDPETGRLTNRERDGKYFANPKLAASWNKKHAGKCPEFINAYGYPSVRLDGKHYRVHRIAWIITYGRSPQIIDHINGIRTDNRLCNLRSVSSLENGRNVGLSSRNRTGVPGVWFDASRGHGKWRARIVVNDTHISLGSHANIEDAIAAKRAAERKYGFHENHGAAYRNREGNGNV